MGMRLDGIVETKKKFKKLKGELDEAAEQSARRSTDILYDDTQKQVPRKTHALANSAVQKVTGSGHVREGSVTYGQPGEGEGIIDYAAAVHEILKARHAPPTKAKYVEDPLVQGVRKFDKVLEDECEEAVKRAFR